MMNSMNQSGNNGMDQPQMGNMDGNNFPQYGMQQNMNSGAQNMYMNNNQKAGNLRGNTNYAFKQMDQGNMNFNKPNNTPDLNEVNPQQNSANPQVIFC